MRPTERFVAALIVTVLVAALVIGAFAFLDAAIGPARVVRRQPAIFPVRATHARMPHMIRFSVFYPETEGATFDHDYYQTKHVPLAQKKWGVEKAEIDKGVNGPYVAAVHFFFPSMEALNEAMGGAATGEIMADMANYTSVQPVIQMSEVIE